MKTPEIFYPAPMPHPDMREECGVCGILDHADAPRLVYLGLTALQHRGQESAGIVSFNGKMKRHVGMGLVLDIFKKEHFNFLRGDSALGHVRYSTTGSSIIKNAQPLLVTTHYGEISIAHNGNLTNADDLRVEMEKQGAIFQTTTDSEVIVHLIAKSKKKTVFEAIREALGRVEGAYSLLIAVSSDANGRPGHSLIAVRDPLGFRPLVMGKLNGSWTFASETCAFDLIGAKSVREIDPGEMVVVDDKGTHRSLRLNAKPLGRSAFCIFEYIYFSRPDSKIFGGSVYEFRREMGKQLAKEAPAPSADCVIAVPDSALVAAIGYAEGAGKPFEIGFIRSHYVGRTFIEPSIPMRDFRARLKYNPIKENLRGKSIVLVDDSIVRGTTSKKLIRMLKNAGVREIHMRISSPPIIGTCHYGIDTPTREELIAANSSVEEIRRFLGVNSLAYLSIPGLFRSVSNSPSHAGGDPSQQFCVSCFTGKYLTKIYPKKASFGKNKP